MLVGTVVHVSVESIRQHSPSVSTVHPLLQSIPSGGAVLKKKVAGPKARPAERSEAS